MLGVVAVSGLTGVVAAVVGTVDVADADAVDTVEVAGALSAAQTPIGKLSNKIQCADRCFKNGVIRIILVIASVKVCSIAVSVYRLSL